MIAGITSDALSRLSSAITIIGRCRALFPVNASSIGPSLATNLMFGVVSWCFGDEMVFLSRDKVASCFEIFNDEGAIRFRLNCSAQIFLISRRYNTLCEVEKGIAGLRRYIQNDRAISVQLIDGQTQIEIYSPPSKLVAKSAAGFDVSSAALEQIRQACHLANITDQRSNPRLLGHCAVG